MVLLPNQKLNKDNCTAGHKFIPFVSELISIYIKKESLQTANITSETASSSTDASLSPKPSRTSTASPERTAADLWWKRGNTAAERNAPGPTASR